MGNSLVRVKSKGRQLRTMNLPSRPIVNQLTQGIQKARGSRVLRWRLASENLSIALRALCGRKAPSRPTLSVLSTIFGLAASWRIVPGVKCMAMWLGLY